MHFYRNSAETQGGAISVRAPSVAINLNILPIFNTRCFIEYEVATEPFSLDPALWEVNLDYYSEWVWHVGSISAGDSHVCQQHSWLRWSSTLRYKH